VKRLSFDGSHMGNDYLYGKQECVNVQIFRFMQM